MTVTLFDGTSLPAGWTAVEPTGTSVAVADGYAELRIDSGVSANSLSNSIDTPQGPYIWRSVTGSWDYAVALAEECINLPDQGLDLLGLNSATLDGIRFACFTQDQSGTFREDRNFFAFHRWTSGGGGGGSSNETTTDTLGHTLYGGPGWLRMTWDEGTATVTYLASMDGKTWSQISQFTSDSAVDRFAIHQTQIPTAAVDRVQRIAAVVDMTGRGGDATTPPPDVDRSTIQSTDFSGGTLPAWLTSDVANGGAVSTDTSGAELTTDRNQVNSRAWLLGPDDLPVDHGILIQYQVSQTGYNNVFWVPTIRAAGATDIPGAKTPDDNYGPGTSLLMELPGRRDAGTDGETIRMLRRSPIDSGETQTGDREFDGYTMCIENLSGEVTTDGGPVTWIRLEAVGQTLRARVWVDGDPEPGVWQYEIEDHMRSGTQAAITMSHNDSVSGAGSAGLLISSVEIYELSDATPEVTATIGLTLDVAPTATATHQAQASVPLTVDVAAQATATHQATASIPLTLDVAATAQAQHQVAATVALTVGIAPQAATQHSATASIPLTLALAPVADDGEAPTPIVLPPYREPPVPDYMEATVPAYRERSVPAYQESAS